MALRAVPDHPKFAGLKARLGCSKHVALGCLESIWHFTGRFTPQGNIGKYTDEAIETWVEWDGQPGELIAALIDTHWIDKHETFRLVVHDWQQHADKATKNALGRAKLAFCTDGVRTPGVHRTDKDPESGTVYGLPVPVPVPVPEPVPESKTKAKAAPAKASAFVLPAWMSQEVWKAFEEMRRKIGKPMTDQARQNIVAKLVRLEAEGHHAEDVLNESITNAWSGVFPLKQEGGGGNGFSNRGQGRTNGNLEALRRATEGRFDGHVVRAGGGEAGARERGSAEALFGSPG